MLNQVQIMGQIISKPVPTETTKKEYIFKLKVEKSFDNDQYDVFDVAIWRGKYLQMKSLENLIDQYVIVKGRIETLNLRYEKNDVLKNTFVIICEDIEYLSKYS